MKYTTAIVRKPSRNLVFGLTTQKSRMGYPDLGLALKQHEKYINTLLKCNLQVVVVEEEDSQPDCCFVEDTAVVTEQFALITRPGALSRRREIEDIIPILKKYRKLEYIRSPGTLDGGDILRIKNNFYVGLSERTNQRGADQFKVIFERYGYQTIFVPIKKGLHLKSSVQYIGDNRVLATKEFAKEFKIY